MPPCTAEWKQFRLRIMMVQFRLIPMKVQLRLKTLMVTKSQINSGTKSSHFSKLVRSDESQSYQDPIHVLESSNVQKRKEKCFGKLFSNHFNNESCFYNIWSLETLKIKFTILTLIINIAINKNSLGMEFQGLNVLNSEKRHT